jgi:hypothetical protein
MVRKWSTVPISLSYTTQLSLSLSSHPSSSLLTPALSLSLLTSARAGCWCQGGRGGFSGNARGARRDDSLVGCIQKVKKGPWKGYKGKVSDPLFKFRK